MDIPPGFVRPDFQAPLDVGPYFDALPEDATAKGMFFLDVIEQLEAAGKPVPAKRYTAFRDYPTREYMELVVEAAGHLYADQPLREGLRRIGHTVYGTFSTSGIGRVIFGVLGNNLAAMLKVAAKGYQMSLSHGVVEPIDVGEDRALLRMTGLYNFVDTYHVGVLEGAVMATGREPELALRVRSLTDADLYLEWRELR